jgi:hypothetical protein
LAVFGRPAAGHEQLNLMPMGKFTQLTNMQDRVQVLLASIKADPTCTAVEGAYGTALKYMHTARGKFR